MNGKDEVEERVELQVNTYSREQTQQLAAALATVLPLGSVVLLDGHLGSGKTTFTQGLGRALGIQRAIKSPTYTIVKEYPLAEGMLIHIDAYRLEEGGADSIDLSHYLRSDTIVLIEWAQFVQDYLPTDVLKVSFVADEGMDERFITASATSEVYQTIMKQWQAKWELGE